MLKNHFTLQSIVLHYSIMNDPKVIIYSATWCAFCHAAKDYLAKIGVTYDDRDVEATTDYLNEAVSKSGQMGIPVLDIDGEIIIGFDRPKIDAALQTKHLVK